MTNLYIVSYDHESVTAIPYTLITEMIGVSSDSVDGNIQLPVGGGYLLGSLKAVAEYITTADENKVGKLFDSMLERIMA